MNEAIDGLYRRYGGLVYRRCLSILRQDEDAWDCVQEIFLRLSSRRVDLGAIASPSAFFFRVATNEALNRLKRSRRFPQVELDESVEGGKGDLELPMRALFLESLWKRFPARTQALAWYRWVDRMTWEETALAAGMSVAGVRKHLARFTVEARRYKEHAV